jgi:hypothetical protein
VVDREWRRRGFSTPVDYGVDASKVLHVGYISE